VTTVSPEPSVRRRYSNSHEIPHATVTLRNEGVDPKALSVHSMQ